MTPCLIPPVISLKHDRVQDWLGKGAQPTETVIRLLKSSGIAVPGGRAAVDREAPPSVEEDSAPPEGEDSD